MEYIEYNPVSKVKNVTYTKRTKNILNAQQIMQLIDPKNFLPKTTGKYKNADTTGFRFCVATALYAFSGMRASEIRALQWKDIDISARRIHIVRAFKSKRHILGPPKSGYARQTVIPEILAPYLSTPSNNPDMWVTGFSTERPMGYKKWHDVFQEVCIEKGTPTTLHALRHALNTMLLEQGVNPELIKAAFGWTSKGNKAEKSFGTNIQENYTHRETYDLTPLAHAIDEIFSKQGARISGITVCRA
ncbi:hypothetical protein AGMMS50268_37420 [Spirochaetia bacterium]|nr:hypothetical protein AGMMS50268_37420 [Spirochaetia bacterium]